MMRTDAVRTGIDVVITVSSLRHADQDSGRPGETSVGNRATRMPFRAGEVAFGRIDSGPGPGFGPDRTDVGPKSLRRTDVRRDRLSRFYAGTEIGRAHV